MQTEVDECYTMVCHDLIQGCLWLSADIDVELAHVDGDVYMLFQTSVSAC